MFWKWLLFEHCYCSSQLFISCRSTDTFYRQLMLLSVKGSLTNEPVWVYFQWMLHW